MHQLSLCNFVSPWWPWSLTLLTVVAATDSTILRTTRTCASCSCALLYNFIIQLFQNSFYYVIFTILCLRMVLAAIALLVAHITACLSSSALLLLWLLLWGRKASPLDLLESLLDLRESLGSEAELSCLLAWWLPWILSLELYWGWWWGWFCDNQVINWPLDFFLKDQFSEKIKSYHLLIF